MKQLFPIREWVLYIFGLLIVWNLFHPLPSFYIEATFSFIPITFLFGHLLSVFLMVMEVLILMYFINEYATFNTGSKPKPGFYRANISEDDFAFCICNVLY